MKPIDALNDLKRAIYDLTSPMFLERFKDQFDAIKSVIERDTPKIAYIHKYGDTELSNCPSCDKGIKTMENYCWHCGQKLYWEKTHTLREVYNQVTGRSGEEDE